MHKIDGLKSSQKTHNYFNNTPNYIDNISIWIKGVFFYCTSVGGKNENRNGKFEFDIS